MLVLQHASLASVAELFRYKASDFELEPFPGYSTNQWGIKAHNRPWIEDAGAFSEGQKIIEVGGAYSSLPSYLAKKYHLEAWIGDDFGASSGQAIWSRWGDPKEHSRKSPAVKYVFERFGKYSEAYPDDYFDRVFSVSTLEHVPAGDRLDVFKDMHRCLKPGGLEIHAIDVGIPSLGRALLGAFVDSILPAPRATRMSSEIRKWFKVFSDSGVQVSKSGPCVLSLLERSTLVEAPRIVYELYRPCGTPKPYRPTASLLIVIAKI